MNLQGTQAQQSSPDRSPVMFARRATWEGIKLAHYRFRSGEIPEHSSPEHLVTLSLGGGCNGEIRTASGFQTRDRNKGNICVIPAGQSYSARLEGESEHLVMLALKGQLPEAEKEFEVALRQAGGAFADANHNLKLCRSLLEATANDSLALLQVVEATKASAGKSRIE